VALCHIPIFGLSENRCFPIRHKVHPDSESVLRVEARSRRFMHGGITMSSPDQEEGAPSPKRRVQPPKLSERLELERIAAKPEIERITSLSFDVIKRHYGHLLVRVSPRRIGMRIRDVLAIAVPRDA
jgi:hypothetical protein